MALSKEDALNRARKDIREYSGLSGNDLNAALDALTLETFNIHSKTNPQDISEQRSFWERSLDRLDKLLSETKR